MLNKILLGILAVSLIGCGNSQSVSPEMKEQIAENRKHQEEQREAERVKQHEDYMKRNLEYELKAVARNDFKVVKMFEHDGCTVYGYEDHHGHYDHFFRCDEKSGAHITN